MNADRRCKEELPGNICQEIQTRHHLFIGCESVKDSFALCKLILRDILKKDISNNEVIFFSFNHRSKSKLKCAIWFAVKALYSIYQYGIRNKDQLLREIIKEIEWNLKMNRKVGSWIDFIDMKLCIEGYL